VWPVSILDTLDGEQPRRSATTSMVTPAASRYLRSSAPSRRRRMVGLRRGFTLTSGLRGIMRPDGKSSTARRCRPQSLC
jgi:hypothetical protein